MQFGIWTPVPHAIAPEPRLVAFNKNRDPQMVQRR